MIIDKEKWEQFGKGYGIYDGAYAFDGRLCFILVEDKDTGRSPIPESKFLFIRRERPLETRFFAVKLTDFGFSTVAGSAGQNPEFVGVDSRRQVVAYYPPFAGLETDIKGTISGAEDISVSINKVIRVGESIYAIGAPNKIYKRLGHEQWEDHSASLKLPDELYSEDEDIRLNTAMHSRLRDLSGFSEQDMYAVGRNGYVCHYDGSRWQSIAFPTNTDLLTVVCADDGQVYITDRFCSVWRGRYNTWLKIVEQEKTLAYFDSAWFDNRLWLANDYGMWVLEENKVVAANEAKTKPVSKEIIEVSGRIDISPDKKYMLICGQYGAALYDGQEWELLFNRQLLE